MTVTGRAAGTPEDMGFGPRAGATETVATPTWTRRPTGRPAMERAAVKARAAVSARTTSARAANGRLV